MGHFAPGLSMAHRLWVIAQIFEYRMPIFRNVFLESKPCFTLSSYTETLYLNITVFLQIDSAKKHAFIRAFQLHIFSAIFHFTLPYFLSFITIVNTTAHYFSTKYFYRTNSQNTDVIKYRTFYCLLCYFL